MSNSLDPDQARYFVENVEPDLGPKLFKGYQQMTNVATSRVRVNVVLIGMVCESIPLYGCPIRKVLQ